LKRISYYKCWFSPPLIYIPITQKLINIYLNFLIDAKHISYIFDENITLLTTMNYIFVAYQTSMLVIKVKIIILNYIWITRNYFSFTRSKFWLFDQTIWVITWIILIFLSISYYLIKQLIVWLIYWFSFFSCIFYIYNNYREQFFLVVGIGKTKLRDEWWVSYK
jgi:hypothetical protein